MRKLFLLGIVLLVLPIVQAIEISSYSLEANIEGNTVLETAEILASNPLEESSIKLLLPPGVKNLKVSINDIPVECRQKEIFGATEANCPILTAGEFFMNIEFETSYPLVSVGERKLFSQKIDFNLPVKEFDLEINLPERAVLPENHAQFLTPEPARIYSNGRKIILFYQTENAEEFSVSVIYEPEKTSWVFTAVTLAVLTILAVYVFVKRKKRKAKKEESRKREKHLLPDEKTVLKIIRESEGAVRQRDIEKQVDFSKAKLSRVLRALEERGLIQRTPKGNTNLIEVLEE